MSQPIRRRSKGVVVEIQAGQGLSLSAPDAPFAFPKITVTLEQKSGHRARLRIVADEEIVIDREPGAEHRVPV